MRHGSFWILFPLLVAATGSPALALPPPDEIPEEILRAEADLAARSPIDNRPLSPSEYEQLRASQQSRQRDPQVSPEVEQLIFLLKLRQGLRSILPF